MNRFTAVAMAALLAVVASACGPSGSSPAGSQAALSTATPTIEPTPATSGQPSLPSSAKDLEALIPNKVGKVTLQKASMSGNEFVGSGNATKEAQDFLDALGVSSQDVSVAIGFGADTGTGEALAVLLFRANGASSDRLLSLFKAATDKERDTPLDWQSADLGGKHVEKATDPEQGNSTLYLYATGDLLVFVTAGNDQKAAEALSALP